MRVAIVGAGPIGQGYAALLATGGHEPTILSPRRALPGLDGDTLAIETDGLVQARVAVPVMRTPAAVAEADVVIVCVLGNGHRAVMDLLAPHITARQSLIVSSHCSLGALYLSKRLAERGIQPLIVAWATTVTGGPLLDGRVQVRLLRKQMDVATLPAARVTEGVELSRALFGDIFAPSENLLAISLSNLNPQIHMANALLNFTRIENGEEWANFGGISEGVGRYIEALDGERLAIAERCGVRVRTVHEHYQKSFPGLEPGLSVHQMAQIVESQRKGGSPGPKSTKTRFITEDVPFGIYFIVEMGRLCGVPTPLHESGLHLANAVYGRDFRDDNDLWPALGIAARPFDEVVALARDGMPTPSAAA